MTVVLALVAAISYGASDFLAGLVSRRASALPVSVVGGAAACVLVAVTLPLQPGELSGRAIGFGVLAGLGGGVGTLALYRGLASGRMSVVAPVSAVGAAVLPVVAGLATGERPSGMALAGFVVAMPAIALVSTTPGTEGRRRGVAAGVVDGLVAGAAFGVLFIGLGKAGRAAGLWPNVIELGTALVTLVVLAGVRRTPIRIVGGSARWQAVLAGILGGTATVMFLLSTHHGMLAVAGVLTSLYPATTVLLAWLVLAERLSRPQLVGLGWAATAIALIALG